MKLGAQMYTLRMYAQNEKDLRFSLKKVSDIGYTEVQLSAIGPIAPEVIKSICDEYGLSIVLTHTPADRILNDTKAVIAEHNLYGCKYIGLGSMPDKYRAPEWISHFRDDFADAAKEIADAGKLLMYHNHDFEFEKFDGKLLIDNLLEDFPENELGFTLDTFWVQAAGADPVHWIEKLKGRIPCVHLKDMQMHNRKAVMAPVLEGNINFERILDVLSKQGGTEHILVEQDVCLESPFVCLEKSYNNVAKLGYN